MAANALTGRVCAHTTNATIVPEPATGLAQVLHVRTIGGFAQACGLPAQVPDPAGDVGNALEKSINNHGHADIV